MQDNTETFVVELRNKTNYWVDERQAKIIDQAWTKKALVQIENSKINTTEITGIYRLDDWYNLHPEKKQTQENITSKFNPALLDIVKTNPDSKWRTCVMMNCELLKKGLLPKYIVNGDKIITKEYYWRESEQLQTS